jgi:acyl-CoA synthetase (AMP-forming)/AMP-acid ligase II
LISGNILSGILSEALNSEGPVKQLILSGGDGRIKLHDSIGISSFEDILNGAIPATTLPAIIPVDLAALIYTSGSTGFPKGVMMTHQSMVFTSWSLIEYLRLTEDERIILLLPLAFDYGLYQLLMAVTIGGTLILEHSFSFPATVYKRIELYQPTVFPGVPTIYAMMINTHKQTGLSFDCIKKVTNTAAALPPEFIPSLKAIFPRALIFKMYGLTECKRVCYLEPELIDEKPGSVGKAIPGTEVFLLDTEGNPVSVGEPGILHIRGPHVMAGYWNNEEQSREMLKQGKIPSEKVLCSHDLFKMDEEGFLYFLGRTDDIIKTRGEKVSPVEIENVIYRIKGVREAAVIGKTDPIMGESIIAFVTLEEKGIANENHIRKACIENLELFMVPERVIILDEMPKSPNGKIDKLKLKTRKL